MAKSKIRKKGKLKIKPSDKPAQDQQNPDKGSGKLVITNRPIIIRDASEEPTTTTTPNVHTDPIDTKASNSKHLDIKPVSKPRVADNPGASDVPAVPPKEVKSALSPNTKIKITEPEDIEEPKVVGEIKITPPKAAEKPPVAVPEKETKQAVPPAYPPPESKPPAPKPEIKPPNASEIKADEPVDADKVDNGELSPDAQKAVAEAAEEAKRRELAQALIDRGTYNVPINAVARKRSAVVSVLLTILFILLSISLLDLMLDTGVILLVQKIPHTHFFNTNITVTKGPIHYHQTSTKKNSF